MTTDRWPYVLSGVMEDGTPYTADGTMQPDGSVLFRVPRHARIKDSTIDVTEGAQPGNQYVIEKTDV